MWPQEQSNRIIRCAQQGRQVNNLHQIFWFQPCDGSNPNKCKKIAAQISKLSVVNYIYSALCVYMLCCSKRILSKKSLQSPSSLSADCTGYQCAVVQHCACSCAVLPDMLLHSPSPLPWQSSPTRCCNHPVEEVRNRGSQVWNNWRIEGRKMESRSFTSVHTEEAGVHRNQNHL